MKGIDRELLNYLGFNRTFDEGPKAWNGDDEETQRSVVTGQRVTGGVCSQQKQRG